MDSLTVDGEAITPTPASGLFLLACGGWKTGDGTARTQNFGEAYNCTYTRLGTSSTRVNFTVELTSNNYVVQFTDYVEGTVDCRLADSPASDVSAKLTTSFTVAHSSETSISGSQLRFQVYGYTA